MVLSSLEDVYLLLGSNVGDRTAYLSDAIQRISTQVGEVFSLSNIYETAAWGNTDQEPFLNQAIAIRTRLTPVELLKCVKQIEKDLGRIDAIKWGPRIIDIDILMYGSTVMDTESLIIPHPFLPQRRFALLPLSELAHDYVHPLLKKTITELLASCPDKSDVGVYSPAN